MVFRPQASRYRSIHNIRRTTGLGALLCALAGHCHADREPQLANLPLEDLLNLTVSTASKLPSTITDAPGIISVYTAEEIALFGARDLSEVLARMPGISPYMASPGNRYRIFARADAPRLNNNHVLFLVNGIPFNRESYGGGLWNQGIMTTFPLDAIQQIEVIRGPGSVLYGSNAYSGVVNIITKRANELDNKVRIGFGGNNTQAANLAVSAESDDGDSEIMTALRYYRTDGEPLTANDDNGEFRAKLKESTPGGLVSARSGGFHTTIHWGRGDLEDIRGSQAALAKGEVDNNRLFVNIGYEHQLGSHWLGKLDASHVRVRTELTEPSVGLLGPIDYKTDDSRLEFQLQGRFSDNLQLVTGLTWDALLARVEDPYQFLPHWRNYQYGAYSQLEYQWQSTRFIGGLQFNKAEGVDGRTVPRMGVIHHINDSLGAKLMYAEAYRAPYALERDVFITSPTITLIGNSNLDHETVQTWDFQVFYNRTNFQSALTLFHTKQKDLIVRDAQSPGVVSFFNRDRLDTEGIELEAKYIPAQNWYLSGSATWQQNEDKDNAKDTTLLPDYFIKAGAGYRGEGWSLAMFDNYQSGYQDNVIVTPNRAELNPTSDAIHNVSLNGTYEIPQLNGLKLAAYINNLLDEDIWLPAIPGFTTSSINTMPSIENGRTFLVTAELPL